MFTRPLQRLTLATLLAAACAPVVLGQPAGPSPIKPPPMPDPKEFEAPPPQPAFETLPAQVQKAARGFDPRCTNFETIDIKKRGGANFYTVYANGPGVHVEMRVIESGTVMSARILEDDVGEAPPELKAAVADRFGKSVAIRVTRGMREYYVEPIHWIKTTDDDTAIVRKSSLNATVGGRYDMMAPGAVPPGDEPLAPMTADQKSESDAAVSALPEAVRAAITARDPELGRFKVLELTTDTGPAWEIEAESPQRWVKFTIAEGGTIVFWDEQNRTMSVVPPEFAQITAQVFPKSKRLCSRQRLADVREYYAAFTANGVKQLAMLRKSGKIEFGADNPLPTPNAKPGK